MRHSHIHAWHLPARSRACLLTLTPVP